MALSQLPHGDRFLHDNVSLLKEEDPVFPWTRYSSYR